MSVESQLDEVEGRAKEISGVDAERMTSTALVVTSDNQEAVEPLEGIVEGVSDVDVESIEFYCNHDYAWQFSGDGADENGGEDTEGCVDADVEQQANHQREHILDNRNRY